MKNPLLLRLLAAAALTGLAFSGCGSNEPTLVEVTGMVSYRGAPLNSGSIVFTPNPEKGGRGPLAVAAIEADGRYRLRTGDALGAVAGWHRVTLIAAETTHAVEAGGFAEVRALVPARYAAPDLSGLEAQIPPGEKKEIDFSLE